MSSENTLIYAIGDIHGCLELLIKIHEKIIEDSKNYPAQTRKIIYIGDYIDRGVKSKEVIDFLINEKPQNFEQIFLKGNHEAAMLGFLQNPKDHLSWLFWGGEATIRSYGVNLRDQNNHKIAPEILSKMLNENLPESHKNFFANLKLIHQEKNYVFVHAGIDPERSIKDQKEVDLLTIREEFFASKKKPEKTVIFGHSIFDQPFHKNGKIAIDTGAYSSGKLTAVRLWQDSVNFLST